MNAITIFKVIILALTITANGITATTTTAAPTSSLHTETISAQISPLYLNCYDDGKNSTGPSEDSGLRFRTPVFDTIIHHHRGQGLHILKEPRKQWLFLLNGPELYRIDVVGEQTIFVLVGLLDDGMWKAAHVGAEIISWHDYYILVVAFEKNLIIYQMEDDIISSVAVVANQINEPTRNVPTFPTIQQSAIPKTYKKILLFTPIVKELMLILAMTDDETNQGRLKTFKWTHTYFTAIEELSVPGVEILSQQENFFIAGRTTKDGNTTINVYKIERHFMNLTFVQTLNVNSRTPHFFFYRERNSIIACTDDESSCKIFRMYDDRYKFHRDSTSRRLVFSKFIVGRKYEVAERGNSITVVPNAKVNCNSSFTSTYRDVSDIAIHINQNGEMYVMLIYVRGAKTVLRAVEVEDISGETLGKGNQDDPEQIDPQTRKRHIFEYTVGQLRSVLLKRNAAMVLFRRIPKWKRFSVQNPITIREGKIDVVNIVGSNLRSPVQLVNRISQLAKRHRSQWRQRRSVNNGNKSSTVSEKTLLRSKRLKVDNLIYPRNIPEDFHLESAAKPKPILTIRQPLTTKSLNTSELLTPQKFRAIRQSSLGLFDFAGDPIVTTGHLNVRTINNVPWSEFYESVFLKNRDEAIEGRLVMQAESSVNELEVSTVNGLAVNTLFNLVQPQIIVSNILFAGLKLSNLQADLINGLDFANDIVFSGTNVTINTPVIMHNLSISDDAYLVKRSSNFKRSSTGGVPQQYYVGKVVVKGTVSVRNLFQEDAGRILVDGQPIAINDLGKIYLLNRTEQAFNTPIEIGRSRVRAPHLHTSFLNGHPTENHLLNKAEQETLPVSLIFMSAHIDLDLINNEYRSHLANLSENVVRRGDAVNITGLKVFQAPIVVDNLVANHLNGIPVSDLVLKSDLRDSLRLTGRKYFEQIKVSGVVRVVEDLKANVLNGFSLNELLNRNYYLDKLLLRHHLLSTNLVFHALNGISFEQAFMNLELDSDRSLIMRKNLIIEGNVRFTGDLHVDTVNGLNWTEYRESLVHQNERVTIDGVKNFARELVVTEELRTRMINNLDVVEIFSNILSKTRPQVITGSYRFGELQVKNIDVTVINQVPTSAFIDVHAPEIIIDGDVAVPAISIDGNALGSFDVLGDFNWNALAERIRELPTKSWRNILVLGNAKWNEGEGTESSESNIHLSYLKSNAVRINGNQVISGNVHLRRPIISNMTTANLFPTELDFGLLIKDGLFRKTISEQVVLAPKSFIVALHVDNLEAVSEVSCNKLNGIDVLLLNSSLYRRSSGEPLFGPLHFEQPPNFGYLSVRGTVNGLDSGQIYHRSDSPLPPLKAKQLHVERSLQIQEINGMNMEYFLANRVTKNGDALEIFGVLEFENLVLNEEISLQSINGIPIDSLVLKVSERLQAITGNKIIDGDLVLTGPVHVMRLNERQNLIDLYQSSILTNLDYNFDDLTVEEAIFEHGIIHQSKEVNTSEEEAKSSSVSLNDRMTNMSRWQAIIDGKPKQSLKRSLRETETRYLLYLDYDLNTRVIWRERDNETSTGVNETYVIGTQSLPLNACLQEMLQVTESPENKNLLFISNTTSNFFVVKLKGWAVHAENYCNSEYRRLRSKITISNSRLSKNIGLPKFIKQVEIFESTDGTEQTCLLLVHAVDVLANRNEVHLLRLDGERNTIIDVQVITQGIGKVLRFFQPTRNNLLIVSSDYKHNCHKVSIYMTSLNTEYFVLKKIIEGNYDVFEYVQVESDRHHLMLSCIQCRRISIYTILSQSGDLSISSDIFQFIKLEQPLAKMLPLHFGDDSRYLLMFPNDEPNFYHIYKFSHIQGWRPLTYGYFDNIRFAIPLTRESDQLYRPLKSLRLLLCSDNKNACKVVKAHIQGVP